MDLSYLLWLPASGTKEQGSFTERGEKWTQIKSIVWEVCCLNRISQNQYVSLFLDLGYIPGVCQVWKLQKLVSWLAQCNEFWVFCRILKIPVSAYFAGILLALWLYNVSSVQCFIFCGIKTEPRSTSPIGRLSNFVRESLLFSVKNIYETWCANPRAMFVIYSLWPFKPSKYMEVKCCVRLYGANFQHAHICLEHVKHQISACVMVLSCTIKHLCPCMAACEYFHRIIQ